MLLFLFFAQLLLGSVINAQPAGWRMVDRFYGFRYELKVPSGTNTESFMGSVVDKAGRLGCFGWVQNASGDRVVGEGRCNKVKGPQFQEWLAKAEIAVGSNFKVMD